MGEIGGFLKIHRVGIPYKDPLERIEVEPYREFMIQRSDEELAAQGGRCMDCGVPFCHNGCPLGNLIPDWNDLVYRGNWRDAIAQLHATNNFPELTGRLCPAPCEAACVLEINEGDAVTIKQIEAAIINTALRQRLGRPAAARARDRPQRRGRRLRARRAWRPRSSCAARATASSCSSATSRPAAWCASASRTSRSRSGSSSAASQQLVAEGVELRCGVERRRRRHRRASCASSSTRSSWRSARACRATCRSRAASSTASTSRWTTSTCATASSPASVGPEPRSPSPTCPSSPPRASTSSSSAAATPAPTASATRSARAPCR